MSDFSGPILTRQIVMIAILSALGGSLSTFVGYLGNLINLTLGVPFGAGQFMAGLHVFWIVLMRVLVPRTGVGTMGGLLKGTVEMFTGSTHGIVVVIVSLVQGVIIDIAGMITRNDQDLNGNSRVIWWLTAGIASASNVIVFQLFYFAGAPDVYIMVISVLAFCSGIIFAGFFAWETLEFLNDTGLIQDRFPSIRPELQEKGKKSILYRRNIPAVALILFLVVGMTYYVGVVRPLVTDPYSCDVVGQVENPYSFNIETYSGTTVTIEAELIGAYIHLPAANYTGVLLSIILQQATPLPEAAGLRVMARDGYQVEFDLNDVMNDDRLILTMNGDGLWLIAAEYDGSLWVRQVLTLQVF
ncbi:MAG: ECF transporter S component [Candidatus Thorarchaeota archaeon]|jgi:energy-coupling factor transport system substrate-specific component